MYKRSNQLDDFHLAGFGHWNGIDVFEKLKVGSVLQMVAEPDNPHDPDAVALYYDGTKIGYVPAERNGLLATMIYFGHGDIFEARISTIDPQAHPDRQLRVRIAVRDESEDRPENEPEG